MYLNKPNLIILYWVISLLWHWIKIIKEGLFKRLENIKSKNEELLKTFSTANRVSKAAKTESDFYYNHKYAFYRFCRDFEKFKRMVSIDSKHGKLKEFYKLLGDFKKHKLITTETKNRKDRILNNVNQLYKNYFGTYKMITIVKI